MTLKERFLEETDGLSLKAMTTTHLIVAVKLPTGAIEIIMNTDEIQSKADYYKNAYDDGFHLKNNPSIQIVNFMVV